MMNKFCKIIEDKGKQILILSEGHLINVIVRMENSGGMNAVFPLEPSLAERIEDIDIDFLNEYATNIEGADGESFKDFNDIIENIQISYEIQKMKSINNLGNNNDKEILN